MLTSLNTQGPIEPFPGIVMAQGGGLTHFVHSSGAAGLDLLPAGMANPSPGGFFTSVAACLTATAAAGRNNRGDVVNVLAGHAENITADAWSGLAATDITINCVGRGLSRPTFTWTLAGSTMLFDKDGFRLRNANLYLAGAHAAGSALTVAAPITVSGNGCALEDCRIFFGFDADQIVTTGISVTGTDFNFNRNYCFGATAAECTSFMDFNAAHYLRMADNMIIGATSAVGVGLVRFVTAATLGMKLERNVYINKKAASAAAVTGLASCTGVSDNERFHYLDDTSKTAWVTSPGLMAFFEPRVVNLAGETGTTAGTVST